MDCEVKGIGDVEVTVFNKTRTVTVMPRITGDAVYSGGDLFSNVVTIIS